jgi:hypothetical protein
MNEVGEGGAVVQRFPTVGIGTSAGGVHALQMFSKVSRTMSTRPSLLSCILIPGAKASFPAFWPLARECR